jgi:two-component system chemotaxis response regulator CheY
MPQNHQVLVVDDDPSCLQILRKFLEKEGYRVTCVSSGEQGLAEARNLKPDLIICDWMMPGVDGPQVCRTIKTDPSLRDTFFIFLTALEKRYIGDGISCGADDFLTKPIDPVEVRAKVKAGLRLAQSHKALMEEANRDALTGAYNRRHWEQALALACGSNCPFLVAIIDLDLLKEVNDGWGHAMGDALLQELVRRWRARLRPGELLARVGGDEFTCLGRRSPASLRLLRRKVEEELAAAFPTLPVGISMGYSQFHPERPAASEALMLQADSRLYRHKRQRQLQRRHR